SGEAGQGIPHNGYAAAGHPGRSIAGAACDQDRRSGAGHVECSVLCGRGAVQDLASRYNPISYNRPSPAVRLPVLSACLQSRSLRIFRSGLDLASEHCGRISMARVRRFNPVAFLLQKLSDFAFRVLTKPLRTYELHVPNDMANLKRHIRKGDVVLVEGNERISECIKYLTQSSWSHSALFVGDEPLRRNPQKRDELIARFGED